MTSPLNPPGAGGKTLADPRRLAALARTGLFPSIPMEATNAVLDRITEVTVRLLEAPASCVTLISDEEHLFAGSAGIPKGPDRRTLSGGCCERVVKSGAPLVLADLRKDPALRSNQVVQDYDIVAYCGVPLRVDGQAIGALASMQSTPRQWTESDVATLTDLASLVEREFEVRIAQREEALVPRRFEPLLNAIPAGIYACDSEGRLVFYNERAASLWGAEPALGSREAEAFAVRGLTWQDGMPVAEGETPLSLALQGGGPARAVEMTLGTAGDSAVALASAEPLISSAGVLAGAVGVLQDVTALRQASRLRDELLALVSHELRTPLTVITGMASFLDRYGGNEPGAREEATEKLVVASRRMERVVENMLQLSHLDHDRADPEPLLAQMLLDQALAVFARDFPHAEVTLLPGPRGAVVSAVERWSTVALNNLLQNAQLYGDGSGPTAVEIVVHGDELQFRICNPGETFTEEEYEALFEPFFRRAATRNHVPGAGLGLTTARKLAEAQAGRVLAGPRPDGFGSMFTFALPAYQTQ